MLLAFAFSLVALDGGLAASSPSRQVRNLLQAPTRLPTLPAAATVPSVRALCLFIRRIRRSWNQELYAKKL